MLSSMFIHRKPWKHPHVDILSNLNTSSNIPPHFSFAIHHCTAAFMFAHSVPLETTTTEPRQAEANQQWRWDHRNRIEYQRTSRNSSISNLFFVLYVYHLYNLFYFVFQYLSSSSINAKLQKWVSSGYLNRLSAFKVLNKAVYSFCPSLQVPMPSYTVT